MAVAGVTDASVFVRLTGDCVLLDPNIIGEVIKLREIRGATMLTNTQPPSFPMDKTLRYHAGELWKAPIGKQREELTEILVTRFMVRIVIGFMLLIWSARS